MRFGESGVKESLKFSTTFGVDGTFGARPEGGEINGETYAFGVSGSASNGADDGDQCCCPRLQLGHPLTL